MAKGRLDWIEVWENLGKSIDEKADGIELAKVRSTQENPWFTRSHIELAMRAIRNEFLNREKLSDWLEQYNPVEVDSPVKVGIICAGNLPLVGFHDIMCVLTSGHNAVIKLSQKDRFLIPALISEIEKTNPEIKERVQIVDKLKEYDAVIATGSNNSLRYFDAYFGSVPHIFRHNRTSVGIIHNDDTGPVLENMAQEIFLHFGLGCRNISKIFIPEQFDLDRFFKATLPFAQYATFPKYRNNFVYHTALFQMNKVDHLTNDLLILKENEDLHAPLSVVYYERYGDLSEVSAKLIERLDDLQVVFSGCEVEGLSVVVPGKGQSPALDDYADHVDTMKWLKNLS